MFRIDAGQPSRYCDGLSRRSFVQIGMAGMGAVGLPSLLRARGAGGSAGGGKETSVILLWLDGGPSQHDTYDPKPEAPREFAGIWEPIRTVVPGMDVTELFPLQAKAADKFSIVRSVHHDSGDHFTGGHWMLTGRGAGVSGAANSGKFPFFGAIATSVTGARRPGMPPNAAIPYAMSIGLRPGYFGGNYLGSQYDPFQTGSDPNSPRFEVQNLSRPQDLTIERLEDRRSLHDQLDAHRRFIDESGAGEAMDRFDHRAFDMVTGERARKAFDISSEDPRVRDRYGRNTWGQSTLLARRLVEAGTTFVTCHFGGWDSHWNHQATMERHLPNVDAAVSSLFEDLSQRGLLDQVLVIVMGEFGRTPKMNDGGNGGPPLSQGTPGRDHWGNAMSVLMGGGGVKGGRIIGSTNSRGEVPQDRPLRPGDIHHTIFRVLGVDPAIHFEDHSGRPIAAIDHGDVIAELF